MGMTPKLTPKQEKFCQEVVKGSNYSDAYRKAYNANKCTDKTINERASVLRKDNKIKARIEELNKKVEEKVLLHVLYDKEAHFKELEEIRKEAMKRGKNRELSSAIRATELKGKLKGHYGKENIVDISGTNINIKIITRGNNAD